jgi:adenosylcobinamide-GDP ribazoletransferase
LNAFPKKFWTFVKETGVACAAAVQFLTIAGPLGRLSYSDRDMGRAVGCFPLVGLLLGAVLAGVDRLLEPAWHGNGLQVALLLAVWVILTGALHADGFLDTCDGLLGGRTPEERLEIMRDPHVGSFAVIGAVLLFLLKFTALAAVHNRTAALILAPTLGRWCVSFAVIGFPYARAQGLGRTMKDNAGWFDFLSATVVAGLTVAILAYYFTSPLLPLVIGATFIAAWMLARLVMTRIPGLTGDNYGAICEVMELLVLVLMALPFLGKHGTS